jgi:rhamnose transport system permease protein
LVGALFGAVLIDLLDQSLVRADQVSEFWRNAILGLLILIAVIGDVAIGRRFRRRWSREAEASTRAVPLPTTSPSPDDEGDRELEPSDA